MAKRLNKFLACGFLIALLLTVFGTAALGDAAPSETVPTHDHEYRLNRVLSTIEPTCTAPGYDIAEWTCTYPGCDMKVTYNSANERPALGHAWGSPYTVEASECSAGQPGTAHQCTRCQTVERLTQAEGHSWERREQLATKCNQLNIRWEECTKCHTKRNETQTQPLFSHTFTESNFVVIKEPTCTQYGQSKAKCDCGAETTIRYSDPLGHQWETLTEAGSCTSRARTYKHCTRCNAEEGISMGSYAHNFSNYYTKKPTCTGGGYERRKCSICGLEDSSYSKSIPATGHKAGEWVSYNASMHVQKCAVCGVQLQSALHTAGNEKLVCGQTRQCSVCGYGLYTIGHTITYMDIGLAHREVCSECGKTFSSEPHKTSVTGGDCTASRTCSQCGATVSGNSSHKLSGWSDNGDSHTRRCTVSGCNYSESGAHQWTAWTLTADHSETRHCSVCPVAQGRWVDKLMSTPKATAKATPTPAPTEKPTSTPTATAKATPTPAVTAKATPTPTSAAKATAAPTPTANAANASTSAAKGEETAAPTTTPTASNAPSAEATATPTPNSTATPESTPDLTTDAPTGSSPTDAPKATPAITKANQPDITRDAATALVSTPIAQLIEERTVNFGNNLTLHFQNAVGASVVDGTAPDGNMILCTAAIPERSAKGEATPYAALVIAWEQGGRIVSPDEAVRISMTLNIGAASDDVLSVPTEAFKLVRVDADETETEVLTEVEFLYENGQLIFEVDQAAAYLLIAA